MAFVIQTVRYGHSAMQGHLWETITCHDLKVCWGTCSEINKPMLTPLLQLFGLLTYLYSLYNPTPIYRGYRGEEKL